MVFKLEVLTPEALECDGNPGRVLGARLLVERGREEEKSRSLGAIDLKYTIENRTGSDYTFSAAYPLLVSYHGMFERDENYKLSETCFIPAGRRSNAPSEPLNGTSSHVEGFEIFDTTARYMIVCPKPTGPTIEQRKELGPGGPRNEGGYMVQLAPGEDKQPRD